MYGTRLKRWHCWLPLFLAIATTSAVADESIVVSGEIVDAVSGERLPARLYVRDAKGFWHFPTGQPRETSCATSALTIGTRHKPKCTPPWLPSRSTSSLPRAR